MKDVAIQHTVVNTEIENTHAVETHAEEHHWPHIPKIQGEPVYGFISNTVITTFVFFLIILGVSFKANKVLKSNKKSKFKLFFLTLIKFFDGFLRDGFWEKKKAREFFPLIVWIFFIVFFGNIFWLMIDWLGTSVNPWILAILRPMHSDINTTLVLSLITLYTLIFVQVRNVLAITYI